MGRAGFNETTGRVLEYLEAEGRKTSEGIARALKLTLTNARAILSRLARQAAVDREKVQQGEFQVAGDTRPRYVYLYSLNGKGKRRLKRITEQEK